MVTALAILVLFVVMTLVALVILIFWNWIRPKTGIKAEPEDVEHAEKLFRMLPPRELRVWRWKR